jgi:hypothetical protein
VPDDTPVCFEGEEEAARAFASALGLAPGHVRITYMRGDPLDCVLASLRMLRLERPQYFFHPEPEAAAKEAS